MRGDLVKSIVALCLVAVVWPIHVNAEEVQWQSSLATARVEAQRSSRPIFLVVTSSGCGWCRKLESTTLRDPRVVQELNARTIPIRVDADSSSNAALLRALSVEGLPTSAIVRPDGRVEQTRAGYLDSSDLLGWLRESIPSPK